MIRFNHAEDGHAIAAAAGCTFNAAVDVVIARFEKKLLGGVIYQNYTGTSINCHMAGFEPNWINKDLLWICFDYPFNQLGCKYMFGQVPSCNSKALDFDTKLGFTELTRIPGVFPNGELVVLRMAREDCRYLRLRPRGFLKEAA